MGAVGEDYLSFFACGHHDGFAIDYQFLLLVFAVCMQPYPVSLFILFGNLNSRGYGIADKYGTLEIAGLVDVYGTRTR